MRTDMRVDQAEGLRRLLVRNHIRMISVLAGKPGAGRTSMTINLAAAIARSGKEVLVLDENHAPNNFLDHSRLYARQDLLDVIRGKCAAREAILNINGFSVLPTARMTDLLAKVQQDELQRMQNVLVEVSDGVDIMLVDTALRLPARPQVMGRGAGVSGQPEMLPSFANGVLMLVVDATASGITDGYALVKRLALENACLQFEIVVNKVADEKTALVIFHTMARVARSNLDVHLEYMGFIPRDDSFRRAALLGRPVVEAFPKAASAKAFLRMAQKLLLFPILDGTACETRGVMQNMMRQVSQPLRQHCRNAA